jgi:hypothetical protein
MCTSVVDYTDHENFPNKILQKKLSREFWAPINAEAPSKRLMHLCGNLLLLRPLLPDTCKTDVLPKLFHFITFSAENTKIQDTCWILLRMDIKKSHYTPWRHRGMRRYSSYSFTSALDGVSGQHHAPATFYPQGKAPWYPLDRRLGRPQCWSGHRG